MGVTYFDETRDPRKLENTKADYKLKCSECSQVTVLILIDGKDMTISSPLRSFTIEGIEEAKIRDFVENNKFGKLHELIREKWIQKMGLDYYCPQCDKIYCDTHCAIEIVYDEEMKDFYDETIMICPQGHKRCMDD